MTNLTYSALLSLSDSEQLLDERIAIICEGEKCGEEEARAILDMEQGGLFTTEKG